MHITHTAIHVLYKCNVIFEGEDLARLIDTKKGCMKRALVKLHVGCVYFAKAVQSLVSKSKSFKQHYCC